MLFKKIFRNLSLTAGAVLLTAVFLAGACSLEFPEKARITGSPKYSVSVGPETIDPLDLSDYLSIKELQKTIEEDDSLKDRLKIYEYTNTEETGGVLTYLIRYRPDPISRTMDTGGFTAQAEPVTEEVASFIIPDLNTNSGTIPFSMIVPQSPSGTPIPVPPISQDLFSDPGQISFTEAQIGSGSISIEANSLTIELKGITLSLESVTGGAAVPLKGNGETFSLKGEKIYPDSRLKIGGTISSSTAITSSTEIIISVTPKIGFLNYMMVDKILDPIVFPINIGDMKAWIKAIDFSEVGASIHLSTSCTATSYTGPYPEITDIRIGAEAGPPFNLSFDEEKIDVLFDRDVDFTKGTPEHTIPVHFSGSESDMDLEITLTPANPGKVKILDVDLNAPYLGETITYTVTATPVFDWKTITFDPRELESNPGELTEFAFPDIAEKPIDFNSFRSELRDKIGDQVDYIALDNVKFYPFIVTTGKFKEFKGDLILDLTAYDGYDETRPDDNKLDEPWIITLNDSDLAAADLGFNKPANFDDNDVDSGRYKTKIVPQSEVFDIEDAINQWPEAFRIKGEITLPSEMTLEREDSSVVEVGIVPELILLIPLNLRLTQELNTDYCYLEFDVRDFIDDNGKQDLLDRDGPFDDSVNEILDMVELFRLDMAYSNRIGPTLYCDVYLNEDKYKSHEILIPDFSLGSGDGNIGPIAISSKTAKDNYPLMPVLALKFRKAANQNYALVTVNQGDFTFAVRSVTLTAETFIDKEFDL
jgi:hypothetical protein